MFAIPFNFPFRKSNGDLSTIGAEINAGGGGGESYTLPTASAETKGGVKIGNGLTMTGEVLSNNNPTPYTLPTASAETKGGVKIGSGLSIDENGVLSTSGGGGGGGSTISTIDKYGVSATVSANGTSELYVSLGSGNNASNIIGYTFIGAETPTQITFSPVRIDGSSAYIRVHNLSENSVNVSVNIRFWKFS